MRMMMMMPGAVFIHHLPKTVEGTLGEGIELFRDYPFSYKVFAPIL